MSKSNNSEHSNKENYNNKDIPHTKDDSYNTPKHKAQNYEIATGLQSVDGLKPSKVFYKYATDVITGKSTYSKIKKELINHYNKQKNINKGEREADIASANIAEILSNNGFILRPFTYTNLHKRIFDNVFSFAGEIRTYNIKKNEPILNGDTVKYGNFSEIIQTLEYDISEESKFDYSKLKSPVEQVRHIEKFISNLWQIHPFNEGNTRCAAVFTILYLRSKGFNNVNNDPFKKHSLYFRNALVRANYSNLQSGINHTYEYLDKFFDNLLFNKNHSLNIKEQFL